MRILMFLLTLLSVNAFATSEQQSSIKEWLALIDNQQFTKSWQQSAPWFQQQVSEQAWQSMVASVREPLGELKQREMLHEESMSALPGAPVGEYHIVQYKTVYENKANAIETVTVMKTDEQWRVVGYFIR